MGKSLGRLKKELEGSYFIFERVSDLERRLCLYRLKNGKLNKIIEGAHSSEDSRKEIARKLIKGEVYTPTKPEDEMFGTRLEGLNPLYRGTPFRTVLITLGVNVRLIDYEKGKII